MSRVFVLFVVLLYAVGCVNSQTQVDNIFIPMQPLPDQLKECSGLVELGDGFFLGLNDSGNTADLWMFNDNPKYPVKKIHVVGATNADWEELASDDEFIYIGDTGNNSGTRKDLTVYKVKRSGLFESEEVRAEKIQFSFPDQKKFSPSGKHNFDCEAMVCIGDSLYVFTKNRGNGETDAYGFPNVPGTYSAKKFGSFDAGGLVTGAAYRSVENHGQLALIGYTVEDQGYHPFILDFSGIKVPDFFKADPVRYTYEGKLQTESILFFGPDSVLITNEEEHGDEGFIYKVILNK
ncbi:MAG: hypothetical protein IPL92_06885 [Saprospiraceae bacterium]|nr:hypothetical protein [Candidatus Opimibacter iunctus]